MILFVLKNCAVIPPVVHFDVFLKSLCFSGFSYFVKFPNPVFNIVFSRYRCCFACELAYGIVAYMFFISLICVDTHEVYWFMSFVVDEPMVGYCYGSVFEQ